MEELIRQIAIAINDYFHQLDDEIAANRRIPSSQIFGALRSIRDLLIAEFGGPIRFRCSKSKAGNLNQCDEDGIDVLEYLLDFSFSRFAIPHAIGDLDPPEMQLIGYRLVFAAESELGNESEVCRDLLKLLDIRAPVRCLIFKHRRNQVASNKLKSRILNVLRNHALIDETMDGWLFIGLDVQDGNVICFCYTLGNNLDNLVPIEMEA